MTKISFVAFALFAVCASTSLANRTDSTGVDLKASDVSAGSLEIGRPTEGTSAFQFENPEVPCPLQASFDTTDCVDANLCKAKRLAENPAGVVPIVPTVPSGEVK